MSRFDRTTSGFIGLKDEKSNRQTRVGKVVKVYEHNEKSDKKNYEVDVSLLGEEGIQHRAIPFQSPDRNEVKVPTVGTKVMVEYREGSKKSAIARNSVFTNEERPPAGKAGTARRKVESGSSPGGDGDLYQETQTDYDGDQSTTDPSEMTPQKSKVRMAKKDNDTQDSGIPASVEIVDDPANDKSRVAMRINKVNGGDAPQTWGVEFDLKTGEFTIVDAEGYGIESDGSGNFTWHHKTIDFSEDTTTSL